MIIDTGGGEGSNVSHEEIHSTVITSCRRVLVTTNTAFITFKIC